MGPLGHGRMLGLMVRHAAMIARQGPSRRLTEEERGHFVEPDGVGGRGAVQDRAEPTSVRSGSQHSSALATPFLSFLTAAMAPLSITDLLEKQRKEKEEASKVRSARLPPYPAPPSLSPPIDLLPCFQPHQPKFLTKAQRQALALENRQKEIEEQKALGDKTRQEREELERKLEADRRSSASASSYAGGGQGRDGYSGGSGYHQQGYGGPPGGPGLRGRGRGGYASRGGGRGGYNDRTFSPLQVDSSLDH